ncbi:hypothetical protein C483_08013 [Natrialba hulunbeirensis JCM 10989]|uniref:eCIS core domain-containing protein n=1 Tax=Natrialba hulunbeirensis JCM 10989 TaxID=1227493 RepID=M0A183_9EURY|nr:DUF4157 domain-containing protein [Natrialba hulunbeirensis]ELY92384.1 hypothetical protein C483_08013 [Natrialba hulunbeirensis JCM 10989]
MDSHVYEFVPLKTETTHRTLEGTNTTQDEVPDTVLDVLGEGGRSLEQPIQRALEERMDADFSNVRVHTGAKAAEAADAIDAKAFTCGNDIVFNSGEYDTESLEGQHLLAHELVHEAAVQALSGEEPLTVNRMGTDVHIQRTALGKLNPFSNSEEDEAGDLVVDEVKAEPEALAEEVRQIKVNQAKLFNQVNSKRGMVDTVGEAAGAGVVGGTAGLVVGAATANPVLGALVGGAVSDVGKTLYGKLWGTGRDAVANASVPEVNLERLGGVKQSIEDLIDEKLRQRSSGADTNGYPGE